MASDITKSKTRFTEIDLLRFLAAVSMMVFHYTIRGFADGDNESPLFFGTIGPLMKYNYLGLDLFFMISGFVILMTAVGKDARGFLISRVVRLYPAYWACCTLTFLTVIILGFEHIKVPRYLLNLTMLNQLFNVGHVDNVYWTLFVEMKFYFLILLLIVSRQIKSVGIFMGLWLIASIILLKFPHPVLSGFLIPKYSAYFISGAMFYLIHKEGPSVYKIAVILGGYTLALAHAVRGMYSISNKYHLDYSVLTLVAILTAFYAVFFLISLNLTKKFRSDSFLILGALSYPIYLLHRSIGLAIFQRIGADSNKYLVLTGVCALIILISYLIHKHIEKRLSPVLKKKLEALGGKSRHPAQLPAAAVVSQSMVPLKQRNAVSGRDKFAETQDASHV